MDAGQIIHDIQDSFNSAVSSIATGENAKTTMKEIRAKYEADIKEVTGETELAMIEKQLAKCEALG